MTDSQAKAQQFAAQIETACLSSLPGLRQLRRLLCNADEERRERTYLMPNPAALHAALGSVVACEEDLAGLARALAPRAPLSTLEAAG